MLLACVDAMHAAPDADGSGGLDYGEFQQGIRKLPGGCIHMTEDDFDLITEWGKHLGVTGEFDVSQFREMMKGELWRFSRRQLKNVLAESTNNEFKSIILMLKLMEIRQMAHTTAQVFFEGSGPARQGLRGSDFQPCLSSEPSSPSVPLAAARTRHTRQQWSCGPEATAAL